MATTKLMTSPNSFKRSVKTTLLGLYNPNTADLSRTLDSLMMSINSGQMDGETKQMIETSLSNFANSDLTLTLQRKLSNLRNSLKQTETNSPPKSLSSKSIDPSSSEEEFEIESDAEKLIEQPSTSGSQHRHSNISIGTIPSSSMNDKNNNMKFASSSTSHSSIASSNFDCSRNSAGSPKSSCIVVEHPTQEQRDEMKRKWAFLTLPQSDHGNTKKSTSEVSDSDITKLPNSKKRKSNSTFGDDVEDDLPKKKQKTVSKTKSSNYKPAMPSAFISNNPGLNDPKYSLSMAIDSTIATKAQPTASGQPLISSSHSVLLSSSLPLSKSSSLKSLPPLPKPPKLNSHTQNMSHSPNSQQLMMARFVKTHSSSNVIDLDDADNEPPISKQSVNALSSDPTSIKGSKSTSSSSHAPSTSDSSNTRYWKPPSMEQAEKISKIKSSAITSDGGTLSIRSLPWDPSTRDAKASSLVAASKSKKGHIIARGPEDWSTKACLLHPDMSEEQRRIATKALAGTSFFFTGAAGTGKSFVLQEIIRVLRNCYGPDELAVVAPTGMAAINIGGQTIHSYAGIGLGEAPQEQLAAMVSNNRQARNRWQSARTVIVDEVSMLSAELFDKLDYIAKSIRKCSKPFGGIQLILCGDFFQLPPVIKHLVPNCIFAFQSSCWKNVIKETYVLTTIFRQKGDTEFIELLEEIRRGMLSDTNYKKLLQRVNAMNQLRLDIEPTRIFPLRDEVSNYNEARLKAIDTKEQVFYAKDCGDPQLLKSLKNSCPAPEILTLKIAAQVVLLKNMAEMNLVNGSRGIVTAFESQLPVVRFETGVEIAIDADTWTMTTESTSASRSQIPLSLAWALSVHKCQGMTLQQIEVSLKSTFENGQAYVAISRVTSLEGLAIKEFFNRGVVKAHPDVVAFYNSMAKA